MFFKTSYRKERLFRSLLSAEGGGTRLLLELRHAVVNPSHVHPRGVIRVIQVDHAP
jgi:hypothetical protein